MRETKTERRSWLSCRVADAWIPDLAFADGVAGRVHAGRSATRSPRWRLTTRPAEDPSIENAIAAVHARSSRLQLVSFPMFLADLVAMLLTCFIAYAIARLVSPLHLRDFRDVAGALFIPVALGNLLTGLYPGAGSNPVVEFRQLSRVSAIAFVGTAALAAFGKLDAGWYVFFALAWPLQFGLAPLSRAAVRRFCRRYAWWGYPVLIFGAGRAATTVVQNLLEHPEYGLRPVVVLDPNAGPDQLLGLPVLHAPRLAATAARTLRIRHAIVALPDLSHTQVTRVLERHARAIRHVMITSAISPFSPGLPILWRDPRDLAGVAGVEVRNRLLVPVPRMIKRTMDVFLTVAGGFCLLPLLGLLAVLVKLSSPGPVLYSHTRIGERGRRFKALKFRSMVMNGDEILQSHLAADPEARAEWERDHKLKNDPRVTRIGALMRKCSLDELPQLWNVLRGQMSLVGPRPIVKAEISKYGKCYSIYKAVRPGITGLWQVSGRNDTTYDERLRYDEFYVRNWSPWLDMHLLARTVSALLFSKGAY